MSVPTQIESYDNFLFKTTSELLKPLSKILDSCGTLTQNTEETSADARKQVHLEIQRQAHQLLDLVNDVRDYAEIQTGRIIIEKAATDLDKMMSGVIGTAEWLVKKKPQLHIRQEIPTSLPSLFVQELRIQQVLINLIHNAVKFTESGEITISVETGEREVTFQVRDTGIGIAQDRFGMVLAPFQTALQDASDSRVGLGLGLPICKYMVEAHQGRMWFESAEGQGSTFCFSLPLEPAG